MRCRASFNASGRRCDERRRRCRALPPTRPDWRRRWTPPGPGTAASSPIRASTRCIASGLSATRTSLSRSAANARTREASDVAVRTDPSVVGRDAHARYVFRFTEGDSCDVAMLGGKGAGLAHMTRLALPVPPGFVVSTRAGREFLANGEIPPAARREIADHIALLEAEMGRRLGDPASPLLVSVRSGAP